MQLVGNFLNLSNQFWMGKVNSDKDIFIKFFIYDESEWGIYWPERTFRIKKKCLMFSSFQF